MASMMSYSYDEIRILDPGAGIGSLFVACVERACRSKRPPRKIVVTAYEIDLYLHGRLIDSMNRARKLCYDNEIEFAGYVRRDFIHDFVDGNFSNIFTHVIMNPPYEKISVSSPTSVALREAGLHVVNSYAAFIAISCRLLSKDGQMAFISPRSFCNGVYFKRFRKDFLDYMTFRRIHLFTSRTSSFRDDCVSQENIIVFAKKTSRQTRVVISSSRDIDDRSKMWKAPLSGVVFDDDPHRFIHILPDEAASRIADAMRNLECTLDDLSLDVSTGKVVDFRTREELMHENVNGAVPLVRPFNISKGAVMFPVNGRKHHNFIRNTQRSGRLLVENGNYVVVKRFATVEEKRRVVAAVWTKESYDSSLVGFENRTNYFHRGGNSIDYMLARGLWAFLNSTMVDTYFRQFSGNMQVNATDLRYLRYPSAVRLKSLGLLVEGHYNQTVIDRAVARIFTQRDAPRLERLTIR